MKILLAAALMLGFPMLTGCATHWPLADRGQDAMDIFTASAGVGAAAQVKVGPIPLGFVQNADLEASGTAPALGLGIIYHFTPGWQLAVRCEHASLDQDHVSLLTVGLSYDFIGLVRDGCR